MSGFDLNFPNNTVLAQPGTVGSFGQSLTTPEQQKWGNIGGVLLNIGGNLAEANSRGMRTGAAIGYAGGKLGEYQKGKQEDALHQMLLNGKIQEMQQAQQQKKMLAQMFGVDTGTQPGSTPQPGVGTPPGGAPAGGMLSGMPNGQPGVGGALAGGVPPQSPIGGLLANVPTNLLPVIQMHVAAGDFQGAMSLINSSVGKPTDDVIWDPQSKKYIPNPAVVAAKSQIAAAGRPVTSVTVTGEKESAKIAAQNQAKFYSELQTGAQGIPGKQANWDQLNALLDQMNTGKFAGTMADAAKTIKGLGIDPASLGISDTSSIADAANALSNQMALQMRSTANGQGMPGAMSDKDREFLQQMIPGISMTPEGRKLTSNFQTRMNQFTAGQAKAVQDYVRKRGGVPDAGVYDIAQQYADTHPIFSQADIDSVLKVKQAPAPVSGGPASVPAAPGAPTQPRIMRFDNQGNPIQ